MLSAIRRASSLVSNLRGYRRGFLCAQAGRPIRPNTNVAWNWYLSGYEAAGLAVTHNAASLPHHCDRL
jgi:hypothetical protein